MKIDIELFVKCYLETASWVTVDSGENNEFTKEAKTIAKIDCLMFIAFVIKEFGATKGMKLLTTLGQDLYYLAPHDFFLTRNGHGAGFWDSPNTYGGQDNADRLTKICENIGEAECYHIKGKKSKLTF